MKYLLVANQTVGGQRLLGKLRELSRPDMSVHLLVPATPVEVDQDSLKLGANWTDPSVAAEKERTAAQRRLHDGLARLRGEGITATGQVGDSDPLEAIADALKNDRYDTIIVSTLPRAVSHWLKMDLPSRAHRRFDLPVIHVEASNAFAAGLTPHRAGGDAATAPSGPSERPATTGRARRTGGDAPALTPEKWAAMPVRERILGRLRWYKCKACGTHFARRKPNCPACKTRKGGRVSRPAGSLPM